MSFIYESIAELLAAAGDRPERCSAYKVEFLWEGEQRTLYAYAPSNQAAIAAVARTLLLAHCKPVPAADLLSAFSISSNDSKGG